MDNKNNSFVVTVKAITDNSNLNTNAENNIQEPDKKKYKN